VKNVIAVVLHKVHHYAAEDLAMADVSSSVL